MADLTTNYGIAYRSSGVNWGAIWSGMFTFTTIWVVFGTLGMAIFATNANPGANAPITGQSTGIAVWSVILTIIAMYVAGRVTGHVAGASTRRDGVVHGIVMFGLSAVAAVILTSLSAAVLSGGSGIAGNAHSGYLLGMFADLGWSGFVALLLGWLAAMAGASQASAPAGDAANRASNIRDIRPAA
jgi:hypothetical protein